MIGQSKSYLGLLVRNAVIEEASGIASILLQAFSEYESLYTAAAFAATTPTASQIQERWHEGPVWVAMQNSHIVGTVAAVPKSAGLYIRSMAVLPAARGQRIAGKLLKEIENFAIDHGYQRLFLSTTPFLLHAIRLYEQFGFIRTSDGPYELHGTPLFTMEKFLTHDRAYGN
jgi:GNAT superfamily N-acetyltransferase